MGTEVLSIDASQPDPALIARAAQTLRGGGLVAFPTETVYGLGASALDTVAVQKIFDAKGRPPTNPLIVHVRDRAAAMDLSTAWPSAAERLTQLFWPGPLTLILPKHPRVPAITTAGGTTVAVRMPSHPVALALLGACLFPLAAPSANRSGQLSPTLAEHVLASLDGRFDLLLDAGATQGGIESTVLDVTVLPPQLLRPGPVTPAEIEAVVGPLQRQAIADAGASLRSPGQLERHYAPRTPLECIAPDNVRRVEELLAEGKRVGRLVRAEPLLQSPALQVLILPADAAGYAAGLYAALHRLDALGLDCIAVEMPPETEEWLAVHDRLRRAAHG